GLVADPQLDDAAFGRSMEAAAHAFAHTFDDSFRIRDTQPGQKPACQQRAPVVVADDREVALRRSSEPEIVASYTDVLAAHDDCRSLRPAITLISIQREVLALFDLGK